MAASWATLLAPLAAWPDVAAAAAAVVDAGDGVKRARAAAVAEQAAAAEVAKAALEDVFTAHGHTLRALVATATAAASPDADVEAALDGIEAAQRNMVAAAAAGYMKIESPQCAGTVAVEVAVAAYREASNALDAVAGETAAAAGLTRLPLPWQLGFAAELDVEPATGASSVAFNCNLVDAHGVGVFQDRCTACGRSIQNGLEYGVGTPRVVCLDCTSASLCMSCADALAPLTAAWRATGAAARLPRWMHAGHRTVVEYHHCVLARLWIMSGKRLAEIVRRACAVFASRPAYGILRRDAVGGPLTVGYVDFGALWCEVAHLAGALAPLVAPRTYLAMCHPADDLVAKLEVAAAVTGCGVAAVYAHWPVGDIVHALRLVQARTALLSPTAAALIAPALAAGDLPHLTTIVLAAENGTTTTAIPASALGVIPPGGATHDLHTLLAAVPPPPRPAPVDWLAESAAGAAAEAARLDGPESDARMTDDTPLAALFTSGSTGRPKGYLFTAAALISDAATPNFFRPLLEASPFPMCWATAKWTWWRTLMNGGATVFPAGESPLDTVRVTQPSTGVLVPSVLGVLAADATAAGAAAASAARARGCTDPARLAATAALARVTAANDALGGRLRSIGVGGAAVPPDLLTFLRANLACDVVAGYGSTEAGGGITVNEVVNSAMRVHLLDRPDLAHTAADTPYPRGEICVHSDSMVPERAVLCEESERAAVAARYIVVDGVEYIRTGDLGARLPGGRVRVLGRTNAVAKLPTGRFLNSDRVESVLAPLVDGVCVTATEHTGVVVAIAVPHSDLRARLAGADSDAWQAAGAELAAAGAAACAAAGLEPFEVPARWILDCDPWTAENGLLTSSNKMLRRAVLARHNAALRSSAIMAATPVGAPTTAAPPPTTVEDWAAILTTLVTTALGRGGVASPLPADVPLRDLGLDSLRTSQVQTALAARVAAANAAAGLDAAPLLTFAVISAGTLHSLAQLLADAYDAAAPGLPLPLSPPPPPPLLARALSRTSSTGGGGGGGGSGGGSAGGGSAGGAGGGEGGAGGAVLRRAASTQGVMLESHTLAATLAADMAAASDLPAVAPTASPACRPILPTSSVLVTGAAGYLGVHLVAHLLAHTAMRVVALVRGRDEAGARARLLAALGPHASDAAGERLVVVAGDVAEPRLGMSAAAYDDAVRDVALIIHAAAAVKFVGGLAGYSLVRAANVVACRHVAAFAIAASAHLHFVSSISAARLDNRPNNELSRGGDDMYVVTKAAGERIFAAAGATAGLSWSRSRPAMLTWCAAGCANAADWLNRLVDTARIMGAVPATGGGSGWDAAVPYMAVDTAAATIASFALSAGRGATLNNLTTSGAAPLTPGAMLATAGRIARLPAVRAPYWTTALAAVCAQHPLPYSALMSTLTPATGALSMADLVEAPEAAAPPPLPACDCGSAPHATTWRAAFEASLRRSTAAPPS